ncbi:similar to Saccharomyces cerevisiae YJL187C SWE1 Protein kinase that regulates the G2/M transition by inhibition of Cdc28p kinase activity [Maudiozyma saulgeensis]|uniref:Similar to Saccharomyces cerevisiae YJL187C SWE1 Protein kinase that regulates the G2/M transition by inhibition of Cdc28p kinase activity n=1 Tax=Maudiozyma saulgeensis TaxID=1789683 RepID=A0A1X7R148_9SACH|nr:similar to Saccharomyces cerevisiae YJL187C SWE1 Protein kinase that regulates the G2/M transition by inhibition of Cdc28p kinase activity [Kazachstania saulgeensis]
MSENDDINMNSDDMIDIPKDISDRRVKHPTLQFNEQSNDTIITDENDTTNNLQFFPYSNNTLTRSAATLNLSLTRSGTLQNITEETDNSNSIGNIINDNDPINGVNTSIRKWSPFRTNKKHSQNTSKLKQSNNLFSHHLKTKRLPQHTLLQDSINDNNIPSTPVTRLKRTASKSEMSPFLQKQSIYNNVSRQVNSSSKQQQREYSLLVDAATNQVNKENEQIAPPTINISFESGVPDPNVFNPTGLRSKLTQFNSSLYPKKLSIPKTPVKKYPLRDNNQANNVSNIHTSSILENTEFSNDPNYTSFTNESTGFSNSPILKTPKIVVASVEESSPLSSLRGSAHSQQRNSPRFNFSKYKKLKKSRDSVIMKNTELTNSLQQFTNDLYGTSTNNEIPMHSHDENMINNPRSPLKSNSKNNLSFFNNNKQQDDDSNNNKNVTQTDRFTFETISSNEFNQNSADNHDEGMGKFSTPTKAKSIIGATPNILNSKRFIQNRFHAEPIPQSQSNDNQNTNLETSQSPDTHLIERFKNVTLIDQGHFSKVYQVTFAETNKKYAIKSISINKRNSTKKILQEITLLADIRDKMELDQEGNEYVIDFISSWKVGSSYYVMTDFYENGNLDKFLNEQIIPKNKRLEDWRIWKIIVEMCLALRFIHDSCQVVHLDLKPTNIMITFEGSLKLVDFGMATRLPLQDHDFENEGDREYIAPEIISDAIYDFRADIFSLGLIIVEIAANVILPDNGNAWHKLRSGDLSDAGGLSSTDIHSESLFSTSTKFDTNLTDISNYHQTRASVDGPLTTVDNLTVEHSKNSKNYEGSLNYNGIANSKIPAWVPKFLIDGESLERTVKWMIDPDYRKRPTANQLLHTEECMYVEMTRLTGAVIQEDDFGPKPNFFM